MIIAFVSPGNAAGVTTTALALTLTWPGPSLLVEAGVAGGQIATGYLRGLVPVEKRSIWEVALATRAGIDQGARALLTHSFILDSAGTTSRLLLSGLPDPFWAPQLVDSWPALAEVFVQVGKEALLPHDILIDLGPVDPTLPFPLAASADQLMFVMRPTLPQVWAARSRLNQLRQALGDGCSLGLCVIGEGPYQSRDIVAALGPFDPIVHLPEDRRAAAVLSRGEDPGRSFIARPLLREAQLLASGLHRSVKAMHQATGLAPAGEKLLKARSGLIG